MMCQNCKSYNTKVIDTRQGKNTRNRRYECQNCHHRFTTTEVFKVDLDKRAEIMPEVITFIKRFSSNSAGTASRKEVIDMFTHGCCYWFAYVLCERFKRQDIKAEIVIDYIANHFGCKINDEVYDITGVVTDKYNWELWNECTDTRLKRRIETDCILF